MDRRFSRGAHGAAQDSGDFFTGQPFTAATPSGTRFKMTYSRRKTGTAFSSEDAIGRLARPTRSDSLRLLAVPRQNRHPAATLGALGGSRPPLNGKMERRYWVPATQTAINGVSGGPHEALLSFENNAGLLVGPQ